MNLDELYIEGEWFKLIYSKILFITKVWRKYRQLEFIDYSKEYNHLKSYDKF